MNGRPREDTITIRGIDVYTKRTLFYKNLGSLVNRETIVE